MSVKFISIGEDVAINPKMVVKLEENQNVFGEKDTIVTLVDGSIVVLDSTNLAEARRYLGS